MTLFSVEHMASRLLARTLMKPDLRAIFIALVILIVLFGAGIIYVE
jgi:hypothetical protein